MPWVRIDDMMPHHPKYLEAGPLGFALQVAGLCYASRYLTDGYIPYPAVPTLLDFRFLSRWETEAVDAFDVARELCGIGIWSRRNPDDELDGFIIHDYLEYNPSAQEVRSRRETDRLRKRSSIKEESSGIPSGFQADSTPPVPLPRPVPIPVVPNPSESPEETTETRVRARDDDATVGLVADILATARFVGDDVAAVETAVARSFSLVPGFDARAGPREAELFVRWKGYVKKPPEDWYRAWLNWIKRAADQQPATPADEPYAEKIRRWQSGEFAKAAT